MRRFLFMAAMVAIASDPRAATIDKSLVSSGGTRGTGGTYTLTSNVGDILSGRSQAVSKDVWHGFHAPRPELLVGVEGPVTTRVDFLRPALPNPSRVSSAILFGLSTRATVDLSIYDLVGRRVQALHRGELPAGAHRLTWDLRTTTGQPAPNGIYFIRLTVADQVYRSTLIIRR